MLWIIIAHSFQSQQSKHFIAKAMVDVSYSDQIMSRFTPTTALQAQVGGGEKSLHPRISTSCNYKAVSFNELQNVSHSTHGYSPQICVAGWRNYLLCTCCYAQHMHAQLCSVPPSFSNACSGVPLAVVIVSNETEQTCHGDI